MRTKLTTITSGAILAGGLAVGGAVLAGPAANAASPEQWDQVAQCESGGDWSIDTGNGFSGGLQFTDQTWSGYGGDQYAPRASQATREQQISVAEQVLAGQGAGAWPVCGGPVG